MDSRGEYPNIDEAEWLNLPRAELASKIVLILPTVSIIDSAEQTRVKKLMDEFIVKA